MCAGKILRSAAVLTAIFSLVACKGPSGPEGPAGPAGPQGQAGKDGKDAQGGALVGIIAGSVQDASGNPVAAASITTDPASNSFATDTAGAFTLADVPVGAYQVIASKAGFADAVLAGVGVASGQTTNVQLVLSADPGALATVEGQVLDGVGDGIAGAVVSVKGQSLSATTDASGAFSIADVPPGFAYLQVLAPAGYLDGETRGGIYLAAGTVSTGHDIELSSRPSDAATFVGESSCGAATCHKSESDQLHLAAHYRSITDSSARILKNIGPSSGGMSFWPAQGFTTDTGKMALDPATGTGMVAVYLCQLTAGNFAMKFGGTPDCNATDGTMVPVSGTYGGEGDGGIDNRPNLGTWKQRYLAKIADVPVAASFGTAGSVKQDWLILPVQITQSGTDSAGTRWPHLDSYHASSWATEGRTFSKKCAGCHNTGLQVTWDPTSNATTSYDYLDLNITCEKCHGPGSEHIASAIPDRKLTIIRPGLLTANGERELCGQCHGADAGSSMDPFGGFGYAYNAGNAAALGGGTFVPGAFDLVDYIKGYGVSTEQGGGVHTWPDEVHGLAHRQQAPMLAVSVHANNPYEQLTCSSCHNSHSLLQGPEKKLEEAGADLFAWESPTFKDNTLCLSCHATHGPYAGVSHDDVAAVFMDNGGVVQKNGSAPSYTATETRLARRTIAAAVTQHMQQEVGMGMAPYIPRNDDEPVGRCSSCHMAKVAKSGGYTYGVDAEGRSALVEGDQGSHTFAVVWPWESALLRKSTGGDDRDIMPNACGSCHAGARLSGDAL